MASHVDPVAAAGSSQAEDHARWQSERAEGRARIKHERRELEAAIEAGETGYRGLRQDVADFGTCLDAVRVRLVPAPSPRAVS